MYFFVIIFFGCQLVPNIGQFICENGDAQSLILAKFYGGEFAANDAAGELREFISEMEKQNWAMENALFKSLGQNEKKLLKNSKLLDGAEFLRHRWETIRRKDAKLAQSLTNLRNAFCSTISYAEPMMDELKIELTKLILLLAQRLKIPKAQIVPKNKSEQKNGWKLLKELAKLWREMKINEKENYEKTKGTKNERKNGQNDKEKQRKMLRLILTAINDDYGINTVFNNGTKVGRGAGHSQKKRRRRKKRDTIFLIALIAVLIAFCFSIYTFCCFCYCDDGTESDDGQNEGAGRILISRQPTEILVKLRYGDEQMDEKGNAKSDHIYIVVGDKEYDFTSDGVRSRANHLCKKCPTKMFSFTPQLNIDSETTNVDAIFMAMWANWLPDSHNYVLHSCVDFAYQFVCRLNNGNCPQMDHWPHQFVEFDQRWVHRVGHLGRLSVFDWDYRFSRQNYELLRIILPPPILRISRSKNETEHKKL